MKYIALRSLLGAAILVLSVGALAMASPMMLPAIADPVSFLRILPYAQPIGLMVAAAILALLAAQVRASAVVAFSRTRSFRARILERAPEMLLT